MWSTHELGISYDMISFAFVAFCCLEANSVNNKRDHVSCQRPSKRDRKSHHTQRIIFIAQSLIEHQQAQFTSACVVVLRKKERKL